MIGRSSAAVRGCRTREALLGPPGDSTGPEITRRGPRKRCQRAFLRARTCHYRPRALTVRAIESPFVLEIPSRPPPPSPRPGSSPKRKGLPERSRARVVIKAQSASRTFLPADRRLVARDHHLSLRRAACCLVSRLTPSRPRRPFILARESVRRNRPQRSFLEYEEFGGPRWFHMEI